MTRLLGIGLCLSALSAVSPAHASGSGDWAACSLRVAPTSSSNWIALGKPSKKMEKALLQRSDNLAFRLKAACAKIVVPNLPIDKARLDKEAVWQALNKASAAARVQTFEDERDPNAFKCWTYFITEQLPADAESVSDEVAQRAPMVISTYELLAETDKLVVLTKAKQSDSSPLSLFRKCQRIGADGNLIDA